MNGAVLISGGGPAGMALALALQQVGIRSRIFDTRPRGAAKNDARILALSHGSRLTLEWLGVWQAIPHTPIRTIHVSHQGGLGRTVIRAEEENVPALGYVLAAGDLAAALDDAIGTRHVAYVDNTPAPVNASEALTIHAEGRIDDAKEVRVHDYDQHAVICQAHPVCPPDGTAWERFTPAGPVALLPCRGSYAVVLTCPSADSQRIATLDDAAFLAALQNRFGRRVQIAAVGPRVVFPLALRLRQTTVGDRQIWIGNAAQTLHPVAGQGFNLALRDIAELADTLRAAADPGAPQLLARYAVRRRLDRTATIGFTDGLIRLFSNNIAPLRHLRGAGLLALDLCPPARSFLARRMMFGARGW